MRIDPETTGNFMTTLYVLRSSPQMIARITPEKSECFQQRPSIPLTGDYTKERELWLKDIDIESIAIELKNRRKKKTR
jgi:hypothetical protein